MIFVDKGTGEVQGSVAVILSELAVLVNGLSEQGITREDIQKSIDLAFMDEEELREKAKQAQKELKEDIWNG